MCEKGKMDERQLWIRGQVFFHSFLYSMALLLGNAFVQDYYGRWASGFWESLLLLFLVLVPTSVELIVREAYLVNPVQRWVFIAMFGACGLLIMWNSLHELLGHGSPFATGGRLTDDACRLFQGVLFCTLGVTLLCKRARPAADEQAD